MHIMEGFLDIYWCIFWFLLCIPFVLYGAYQLRKVFKQAPEQKLTVAISGAFIFVLSSLKLPSVTGSSSHPTGTGLSTILAGPWVTSILASIVLIFQALLLAHGGLTTLGANVFSMGIVGPFVAYGVYRSMVRLKAHPVAAVFVTAFVADFATYVMTSLQLALAYPSDGMILPSLATFLGIFAITQVPLAVVESVLIVMFFDYLANSRPELTRSELLERKGRKFGWVSRAVVGAVVVIAIISVPLLLYEGQAFEGADDQGGGAITDIDPDYRPWFQSLFEPSEALEPYLFYLQTFIGLAVLMLVIFLTRRRKRHRGATKPRLGMDELAHQSPMRDWPPLGKLLLTLSLLVVSLLSQSVIVPMLIFIFGLGMLFYSSRLQMPRIVALALLDGLLIILIGCIVIALLTTGGSLYTRFEVFGLELTVYENGIDLATMVLFRALAGMTVMLVFITSTPVPHLAHALRQLRIPQEVVELTILVYRYSFLLLEQLEVMHVAASNRLGFHGTRNRVRTSSKLAVGLFSRSMEIASRSQVALQCRNFNGDFPTFRPPRKLTWEWVLVPLLLASVIYLWNLVLVQMMG